MIYSGEVNKRNGVGVIVAEKWTKGVVSMDRVSDRLMAVKLVMDEELVVIISACGPQTGCEEGEKERFMEEPDELVGKTEEGELLVVCGDLNGHVGKETEGLEEVHGGHGYGNRNREGRSILEMAQRRELVVCNTWYRKKEEHLFTFSSGGRCSQIDYILVNKKEKKNLKNCKVMPGSHVVNQHNLVVLDMWRGKATKAKVTRKGTLKTWELKMTGKK